MGSDASPYVIEAMRLCFAQLPPRTARFIIAMGKMNLVPLASSISTPLHLLLGEQDTVMPRERHSDPVVDNAPDADLTLLPGVGHLINWEAPGAIVEAVSRA